MPVPRYALVLAALALGACSRPAGAFPPAAPTPGEPGAEAVAALPDTTVVAGAALSPSTARDYRRLVALAASENVAARPFGEIVQWVSERLVGRPYVAGMLDAPARETLVVSLEAFDCVLFVENAVAVARTIALGDTTLAAYAREVERLRYRGGRMDGYGSRLHYFSDWIADNAARGEVRDVTAEAGGVRYPKTVSFMSANRASYPRLADDAAFAAVQQAEARLAGVELRFVPQERIAEAYAALEPGDIVATATTIARLDVTHTGFVVRDRPGGPTGFLHASTTGQVMRSPDLAAYVQGVRAQTGILVARPLDPRASSGERGAASGD